MDTRTRSTDFVALGAPGNERYAGLETFANPGVSPVELTRHTDAAGDVLTADVVRAAIEIGARLAGGYDLAVSTGAQRATQTLACFLAGLGERVPDGVVVETGLRSEREERWREAYQKAGSGELDAMGEADPELVESDSAALGEALGGIFARR